MIMIHYEDDEFKKNFSSNVDKEIFIKSNFNLKFTQQKLIFL